MDFAPPPLRLRTTFVPRRLTGGALSDLDHVIIVLPAGFRPKALAGVPFGATIKTLRDRAANKNGLLHGVVQGARQIGLTIASLPRTGGAFEYNTLARSIISSVMGQNPARVGVHIEDDGDTRDLIATSLIRASLAACAPLRSFRSKRAPKPKFRALSFYGAPELDVARLKIEAEANHLARWVTAQPPNVVDAKALVNTALEVAERFGFESHVYDELELEDMGAEAFLAVARANAHSNAAIVHLQRPGDGRRVAFVGKGVCYDTGGINVKPANYMNGMHEDMEGSAVALATFVAMSRLDETAHLDCWMAVTENRISSDAYTPNEVVTALNGTTIEVIHSDAEGRMALADTLVLASRTKPDLILDYATLTGACVGALTSAYTGVFTNRDVLHNDLISAGKRSGERVWPFPLDADFDKAIESQWADTKQCAASGTGDHIHAARFLGRFVDKNVPWVHMDLSAGNNKGGLGHIATDCTGFGVHVTAAFLLDGTPFDTLSSD